MFTFSFCETIVSCSWLLPLTKSPAARRRAFGVCTSELHQRESTIGTLYGGLFFQKILNLLFIWRNDLQYVENSPLKFQANSLGSNPPTPLYEGPLWLLPGSGYLKQFFLSPASIKSETLDTEFNSVYMSFVLFYNSYKNFIYFFSNALKQYYSYFAHFRYTRYLKTVIVFVFSTYLSWNMGYF